SGRWGRPGRARTGRRGARPGRGWRARTACWSWGLLDHARRGERAERMQVQARRGRVLDGPPDGGAGFSGGGVVREGADHLDDGRRLEKAELSRVEVVEQGPERLGAKRHRRVQTPAGVEVEFRRGGTLLG